MRLGGTVRKRAAIAGSAAIVSGVAAATVGLSAAPALADSADVSYTCNATLTNTPTTVPFALTLTVNGTVATAPTVGDAVTLNGFQLQGATDTALEPLLTANGVDTVTGTIDDFPVTADGAGEGSSNPGTDGLLSVTATVGSDGSLSFTTPASGIPLTGFTANVPGAMNFSAGDLKATLELSGPAADPTDPTSPPFRDTATVDCTGTGQFATATVADKAPPPPPPGTGTGGAGDNGGNGNNGGNNNGGNGGNTSAPPSGNDTTTPPATTNDTTNTTSARGTLASTGTPYTVPMTATGAALLLLGGGMLVAGRRRRDLAVEGPADDDSTDETPDTDD